MSAKRVKVVVTRKLPAPVELRLKELFDARLNDDDHPFTQDELAEAMQTADVLVPTVTDKLDGRIMARAGEQLRLIAQFGAGVDNIDVQSAVQRGITVTNTPGVLTDDTADVAMALILSVPRRLFEGAQIMNTGGFDGWTPTWMMGRRLAGKRLGIIGMGRIGQAVARRAKAFGLPNVVLLPHMGSATIEGRTEMGEKVIINIKTFADGHRPPDRVIPAIL